jgi:hypothetical protein
MQRTPAAVASTALALSIAALLQPAATLAAESATPAPQAAPASPAANTLAGLVQGGKVRAEFRYRLEYVDQDPFADEAYASTLRSRLGLDSGQWNGLSATLEFDNVTVLGDDDAYNSTTNGVTDRPVVVDPEYTEVNLAYLQYKQGDFTGVLGRQRITLDNQRFIGNVGWRQNEQTFDALTLKTSALAKTALQYSYIANINRITGPDEGSQPANYHGAVHALNGKLELGALGAVTAFGYLLDLDNAAALSSSTFGLHWTGKAKLSEATSVNWTASYAAQSDYADNPNDYDADYFLVEAGATHGRLGFKAGYEVLGGDDQPNHAFQTPLATLHAFQGWGDKFLTTPAAGVEDLYLGGSVTLGAVKLDLTWHDFAAEATNSNYGDEWNASATWKLGKNYDLLFKLADYSADEFATDTTKAWLQFSATF